MKKISILSIIIGFIFIAGGLLYTAWDSKAAVPQDFQTLQIVGSGLNGPSGFEIAPDGRIFILQRTGEVRIYKNGQLLPTPFITLPSENTGDRGLIGVAFDPQFNTNFFVYFYYTGLDQFNHLVRVDASEDVDTKGALELYRTPLPSQLLHVGGTIRFGGDGKLYLSVGDNGYSNNAQDLSNPFGKVLRLNKNGSVPSDNPFVGQPNVLPEIWAYGFRNPFRFQFDAPTGKLYLGDVGSDSMEEINVVARAGNYGWPMVEGMCPSQCPYTNPIYAYPHTDGASRAVAQGPVYRGSMFPAEYQGSVFFGDYAAGFIKRLILDGSGNVASVEDFDTQAGSVVDMKVAADGSLYYITYFPGRLYRVVYSTTSHVPTANASADVTNGHAPLTVQFSSAGSSDPDEDDLDYLWDFGDGTTSTVANPTKIYTNDGAYTVDLSVSDGTNVSHAVPIVIQVGVPPTVIIASPTQGSTFKAGDTIFYTASGHDGAGRDLPDSAFTTEVRFHHADHFHPFLGPITSHQSGTFTIPTTGETSANIWYEIIISATDINGLTTAKTVNIFPIKTNLTFNTNPANLSYYLDGIPHSGSFSTEAVVGFERELNVEDPHIHNNQLYNFVSWSDGGAPKHFITTPTSPATFTANYSLGQPYVAQFFNNQTLTGTPALTQNTYQINYEWGGGSPGPGIATDHYSARFTKTDRFNSGNYDFVFRSDDGIRVYFDNQIMVDRWFDQGPTTITLNRFVTAGNHQLRIEYYENSGGAELSFSYKNTGGGTTPPPPPPASGFIGQYWNAGTGSNPTIPTTAPTFTRNDTTINFDWNAGSPDASINNDHFVARWTQDVSFTAGNYEFTITGDDGVRLYIDNSLVVDKWIDQGSTAYTVIRTLSAGTHNIKMEYYENIGGALARLSWAPTSVTPPPPPPPPVSGFVGQYWNAGTGSNPTIPTTAPTFTKNDSAIDFDWGGGSPDSSINADHFVARWTQDVSFTAGNYEFTVTGDDGVRLYVDNVLVIDKWIDQGSTTYTTVRTLTDGSHNIKMEYYENTGGAVARLSWTQTATPPPPPPPPPSGFSGQYWNAGTGSNPTIPTTAPTFTRNDPTINFNWGGGSPDSSINADHFVARWTQDVSFTAGNYEFTITGDDGVRLYVDNVLVIDKWIDQGSTTYTVIRTLSAGTHNIKMEYYENTGGALARLSWAPTSVTPPPPPPPSGFSGQYWNAGTGSNPTIPTTAPTFTRNDPTINFNWGGGSPDSSINIDHFVARWTGTKNYSAGTYTLTTHSDDGVRVFVDGNLVINNWTDHAFIANTANVTLTAGSHTVVVEYYENAGNAILQYSEVLN